MKLDTRLLDEVRSKRGAVARRSHFDDMRKTGIHSFECNRAQDVDTSGVERGFRRMLEAKKMARALITGIRLLG